MAGWLCHGVRLRINAVVLASGIGVLSLGGMPAAQFEKPISPTYDGWSQLPDGSYDLVFGYMNRNAGEVDVPIGLNNGLEPAPIDQGQPTHFLPGRQRDAFRIHVPKGFKGKFVWTLSFAAAVQTANGSLDQNYSLDVGDPDPPALKSGPAMTIHLGEAAPLSAEVGAPPAPKAPENPNVVARQARGTPITVWWSKFRGPGTVTFGDGNAAEMSEGGPTGRTFPMGTHRVPCPLPLTSTCGTTTARFSAPGTYWLRVVAAERSAANAIVKIQVNP
jgi:hypothetical protein